MSEREMETTDDDRGMDQLHVAGVTLTGVARGGVETCLMAKELGVMFDIGMCPPGAQRYGTVLASHAHADHLGGVHYLASLRSMFGQKPLKLHVPVEAAEPLQRIFAAWSELEGYQVPVEIFGHAPGATVTIRRDVQATCFRTVHRVPSLAWVVERVSRRLKPEFQGREGAELKRLRQAGVEITDEHRAPELCVTGDTQIEFLLSDESAMARRARVLVHEVTSWEAGDAGAIARTRRWGHTHIDELIAAAERFEGEALVLVHRSMRHSRKAAEAVVARMPPSLREKVHLLGN